MASADLLLHPVRLRIVKAFLGERALTVKQLAAELADVPAGSIYRHVARLTEAGVLQVVAERRGDFDRYIASEPEHPGQDGAGYRVAAMWLTDAELADYLRELAAISQARLANAPGPGRRRRMLYTVLLPGPETGTAAEAETETETGSEAD